MIKPMDFIQLIPRGYDNAVKSRVLEEHLDVGSSRIREIVNLLRQDGIPICSGASGYYLPVGVDDIELTINQLNARISGIAAAVKGLEIAKKRMKP